MPDGKRISFLLRALFVCGYEKLQYLLPAFQSGSCADRGGTDRAAGVGKTQRVRV